MKTRVAMLFGGKSVEHEVSVISGIQAVMSMDTDKYEVIPVYMTKRNEMYIGEEIGKIESYKNIDELLKKSQRVIMTNEDGKVFLTPFPVKLFGGKKPVEIDVAFPVVHGTNVEDGAFQGYLKTMGIPFVGCDVTASAIGMDKYIMKAVLKECDVPVLDAQVYTLSDYAQIETLLDKAHITANKNTIPNDPESPFVTSGIRLGTPAATTRGLDTDDFDRVAEAIAGIVLHGEDGVAPARAIVDELTSAHPLKGAF